LVTVDAAGLTTRELNARLKGLAASGQAITVLNPQARHNIAVGIFDNCRIEIKGSVGYYSASLLDGPEVTIDGNAGWALGDNMMAGKITLTKDAGASVGSTMRGGELFVGGNAGARAGISMKGGTLIVGGNAGFLTGFMMQKGRIIVCGDVGEAVGDSMYEGAIYVGGKIGSLAVTPRPRKLVKKSYWISWPLWTVTELNRGTPSPKWFRPKSCTTSTPWNAWKRLLSEHKLEASPRIAQRRGRILLEFPAMNVGTVVKV